MHTNFCASSIVMPLALRSSKRRFAYFSASGLLHGSMIVAFSMFARPFFCASERISSLLPKITNSAIPSAIALSAALSVRSSVPSGSTMRCLFCCARAIRFLITSIVLIFYCYCIFQLFVCGVLSRRHCVAFKMQGRVGRQVW